jgi:hypothetical protein
LLFGQRTEPIALDRHKDRYGIYFFFALAAFFTCFTGAAFFAALVVFLADFLAGAALAAAAFAGAAALPADAFFLPPKTTSQLEAYFSLVPTRVIVTLTPVLLLKMESF